MGLKEGVFPPVDPATFMKTPYLERIKILSRHWGEYGFGAPKITAIVYVAKLLFFYALIGLLIVTLTSGHDPFSPKEWWDQPIIWQKLLIWTMFLEAVGFAGSWGPLAGHFKPMTGGILYWARTGTLKNPPFPDKVPGTKGHFRTPVDVALYLGFLTALFVALVLPGADDSDATALDVTEGLVRIEPIIVALGLLLLLGLRDKISFLAARSEQYAPALIFFAFFPFVDMIIAAKILIVAVWCGAALSKLGHHFGPVIPPMVSNTPWLGSRKFKKMQYRDFPEDLRPSERAGGLAHGLGTLVEFVTPLVLLFSHNETVTIVGVCLMIGFHMFIISTFPLAVPLEWNALFAFITAFLFLGFPAYDGFDVTAMDNGLLALTLLMVLFFPILGNLRPDLVSFLPSMRQYSGNWATAMWAFAPGGEEKLDKFVKKPSLMQKGQLTAIYGEEAAEVVMQQLLGWRAMHSQGRALNSIMINQLGSEMNTYTPREAEFSCNALTGFNFGDGHMHNWRLIEAIQSKCNFAPGEWIVVWIESDPVLNPTHSGRQDYLVIDAAVGIIEKGDFQVKDAVAEQPWLPNGPIKVNVKWRKEGYTRQRHDGVATPPETALA